MTTLQNLSSDFLVIGSGIAGLCFAIKASRFGTVTIVTKKNGNDSNTNYAQGGIACVLDPTDSFASHINDTIVTGHGLCNQETVEMIIQKGPVCIQQLLDWGAHFTTADNSTAFGHLDLGREGGHTRHRIVHANDLTGSEIEQTLLTVIKQNPAITILENHCLVELITNHHLQKTSKVRQSITCYGAYILSTIDGTIHPIRAKTTFLATGGAGQVYKFTTNPLIATGDGFACAYRAGAEIRNMEFIQFHPTSLYHPDSKSFLISEAIRGYGAILVTRAGVEFMKKYHPMHSLAPRDIVAQAIDTEMKMSADQCVYLDVRHQPAEKTIQRFPQIYQKCKQWGIDITKDLIPVVPASHYICGGITVDKTGRTTIRNLYAGGEVACSGMHGANRLASNSLLEALVFGFIAAECASKQNNSIQIVHEIPTWDDSGTTDTEEWILISHNLKEIQSIMWDYVGIVRSNLRLERAQRRILLLEKEIEDFYRRTKITMQLLELRNIVTVAKLIIHSALNRKESRGLHYTTDFPHKDDTCWKHDTIIKKRVRTP